MTKHDGVLFGAVGVAVIVAGGTAWYTYGRSSSHKSGAPPAVAQATPVQRIADQVRPAASSGTQPVTLTPQMASAGIDQAPAEAPAPAAAPAEPSETPAPAAELPPPPLPPGPNAPARPDRIAERSALPAHRQSPRLVPSLPPANAAETQQSLTERRVTPGGTKGGRPVEEATNRPAVREPAGTELQGRQEPPAAPADPVPAYARVSSSPVGLLCELITADTAGTYGLDRPEGMVVTGLTLGSAAARAGIRRNDVILAIKGEPATSLSVLTRVAAGMGPGQAVPVSIMRNGSRQVVMLDVGSLSH